MPTLPSIRDMLNGALPEPTHPSVQDPQVYTNRDRTNMSRVPSVDQLYSTPAQVTAFAPLGWKDFRGDRSDTSSHTDIQGQMSSPGHPHSRGLVWSPVEEHENSLCKPMQNHLRPSRFAGTTPSTACSSPTIGNSDLDDILMSVQSRSDRASDLNLAAIRHSVSKALHGIVRPAYTQGWYQPCDEGNKFCSKLEDRIHGLSMNELVSSFFRRNTNRATYGDRVVFPRRLHDKQKSESPALEGDIGREGKGVKKPHAVLEQERRERHRDFQNQSCSRSPDIAAECGGEHADESKEARTQRAKGPGKDEQLCTAIYSQELSGRVVQSEHDGRLRAEKVAYMLLELLEATMAQQKDSLASSPEQDDTSTTHRSMLDAGRASRKRTLDEVKDEESRAQNATSDVSKSHREYERSHLSASSPWKRYLSHYNFHRSSSTLQSLPPSPAPSLEENEVRSSPDPTSQHEYKIIM